MAACRDYGSHLAHIETQTENDWIVTQLKSRNIRDVWVGGSSSYHPGVWEWIPGLKRIDPFTNWSTGEPNNPITERCLHIKGDDYYKWNDFFCTSPWRFVCEKNGR